MVQSTPATQRALTSATPKKRVVLSRAELLQEAILLEQMNSEWTAEHTAAFCTLSVGALYKSTCPRVEKRPMRGVTGRGTLRFLPAAVREWNAQRTQAG